MGVLGEKVAAPQRYAPEILEAIPRHIGRGGLPLADTPAMKGADVWHLYEISWENKQSVPQHFTGALMVPCSSAAIVESKSLKLYFNSLNFHQFESTERAQSQIEADLNGVVDDSVRLLLWSVDELDDHTQNTRVWSGEVPGEESQLLISHSLRSLCPITAQPDWATLRVRLEGVRWTQREFERYVASFRRHQEYHEQCVERIYCDLWHRLKPKNLEVVAFYQRRGGIDITPWRSSKPIDVPAYRLSRQ